MRRLLRCALVVLCVCVLWNARSALLKSRPFSFPSCSANRGLLTKKKKNAVLLPAQAGSECRRLRLRSEAQVP